jgi:pimeloyl-ACP methyl ester carboxylesterase
MAPLVEAGYRVAIPDVRGYGGSLKPEGVEAYDMIHLTNDVLAVIEGLQCQKAILVGHDWGAPICWNTAILHPAKVRAVAGLSVPFVPRASPKPTERLKAAYGDRFFYQLYFQRRGEPEDELEADLMSSLRKILYAYSGDVRPEEMQPALNKTSEATFLQGLPDPPTLPPWLSEEDLQYYYHEFKKSGLKGPLNRYRNIDRDWLLLPQLSQARITQPAMFVAGDRDPVLKFFPTSDLLAFIRPFYDDLRVSQLIVGKGHWIQQEAPQEVNELLLRFFAQL